MTDTVHVRPCARQESRTVSSESSGSLASEARGYAGPPRAAGSAALTHYGAQLRGVRTGRRSEDPQPPACSANRCDMPAVPALGSYLATTAGALPMGPAAAAAPPAPPGAAPAAAALNTGRLRWGGSRFFRSSTDRTRTTRWWMAASTE